MALPKLQYPIHDVLVPSTNKKIKVRPILTKEEKILLMAKESSASEDILSAVKQVVNNCILDDTVDIDKFTTFDIEFLFLKLRALSISDTATYSLVDNEDSKVYDLIIDLNKVEVKFPDDVSMNIKITDEDGILMKYPDSTLYSDDNFFKLEGIARFEEFVYRFIDKIFFGDQVFIFADQSKEDRAEYLDSLDVKTMQKVRDFMNNIPTLYYKTSYKTAAGKEHEVVLTTLTDFFML